MYLALGAVHPITLAVGNTMKRVFIMVAAVMVFRNPISLQAGIEFSAYHEGAREADNKWHRSGSIWKWEVR